MEAISGAAYRAFKERQDPPFICYLVVNSNNFFADDSVYFPVNRLQIELYTSDKDPETEKKLEMALQGVCWEKSESLIESEQIQKRVKPCIEAGAAKIDDQCGSQHPKTKQRRNRAKAPKRIVGEKI